MRIRSNQALPSSIAPTCKWEAHPLTADSPAGTISPSRMSRGKETEMGKYALAWLLGVPGVVLVAIYLFTHL